MDKGQAPLDVGDQEILTWYKNMLTGTSLPVKGPPWEERRN